MKHKNLILGVLCGLLVVGAFWAGHYAGAATNTPGSTGDPLITLSYLEGRLASGMGGFEKVTLVKGQILQGEEGTGVVVLGGSVIAEGGSLADLTQGTLTQEDTSLFLYHSYIVPEKNVGCEALSSCTLFVSGEYTIK